VLKDFHSRTINQTRDVPGSRGRFPQTLTARIQQTLLNPGPAREFTFGKTSAGLDSQVHYLINFLHFLIAMTGKRKMFSATFCKFRVLGKEEILLSVKNPKTPGNE
jgi:hypothetical protein